MVTLWGHTFGQPYAPVASTTTLTDGSYKFTVTPQHNEVYQVRTTFAPSRASAQLFEGVEDTVGINASAPTSLVGQTVTFTGFGEPGQGGARDRARAPRRRRALPRRRSRARECRLRLPVHLEVRHRGHPAS